MSENDNVKFKRHLAFSFILGCALFLFSVFLGGGGHGTLLPLQVIFPIPALIGYFLGLDLFAFMLCLVQFPIYSTIINLTRYKKIWVLLFFLTIHFSLFAVLHSLE